ncbi:hypothetical protein RchiOBHm_Chr5g0054701 [Rosa chinensis]|uniref:Uncharacterized protein n=1 Tax=Rosa chinensis TaxID=74649 RepID=A0A2P6QG73_ROSCH|nr:uncharacterized protein LOC112166005 [Rosa chinensis]PRQ33180.1 hypothetical protein RchiOBHm_Chr5g0054701 [Rosa chinensis]
MLGLEIELEMGISYFNPTRRRSLNVRLHTNRELIILIIQRLELGSKANSRRLIEFNSHARAKVGVTLQSAGFGRSSLIKILERRRCVSTAKLQRSISEWLQR